MKVKEWDKKEVSMPGCWLHSASVKMGCGWGDCVVNIVARGRAVMRSAVYPAVDLLTG